jgi:hypothetical protein
LAEKKTMQHIAADAPEGHDKTIDELANLIEDGQVFRKRRKGKPQKSDSEYPSNIKAPMHIRQPSKRESIPISFGEVYV